MRRLSREIDTELTHEVDEVAALQRTRVDPQTKRPFVDADQLLLAVLAQAAPSASQELVAVSDGRVIGRSPKAPILALESDRQLVKRWAAVSTPHVLDDSHLGGHRSCCRGAGDAAVDRGDQRGTCSSPRRSWTASVLPWTRPVRVAAAVGAGALLVAIGIGVADRRSGAGAGPRARRDGAIDHRVGSDAPAGR